MSDIFISYSRHDKTFVQRLFDALEARHREVWVDWEDIPRGEHWLQEIYTGIEGADTFLFVVSEHSLSSEVCHSEISHALNNHKRIVPIIRESIDEHVEKRIADEWFDKSWETTARSNWQQIKTINWLFFRENDDFDAEFQVLLQTLDTDLPHLRMHTRLLVRAKEWETSERDRSLLLHGTELAEAESWLVSASAKDPKPTERLATYIVASRKAAMRRQRMILTAVSVALAVTIGLVILSLVAVMQTLIRLPVVGPGAFRAKPGLEMRSQGVEVHPQPIGRNARHAVRDQPLLQIMHHGVSVDVLAPAQMQCGAYKANIEPSIMWINDRFRKHDAVIWDGASTHRSKAMGEIGSERISLPPYSPEPNPCERVFEWLRGKIEGEVYASLDHKRHVIDQLLRSLDADKLHLGQLVGWQWIHKAFSTALELSWYDYWL